MPETSSNIQIKLARLEDRKVLIEMFLKLLEFLDQFEHDMLPTRENAEWMTHHLFIPAALNGEAVLIAWDGDRPIGALFWVVQRLPYQIRWSMAYGYGTYVEAEYRSKKIGTLLRKEGRKILKEKGIQKLMTMAHFKNEISIKASNRIGWVPFSRIELTEI